MILGCKVIINLQSVQLPMIQHPVASDGHPWRYVVIEKGVVRWSRQVLIPSRGQGIHQARVARTDYVGSVAITTHELGPEVGHIGWSRS